jgi:hypothetical protein
MTTKYTYDERRAIEMIRKTMVNKPDIIKEIMKDMAYLSSFNILKQASDDLKQLLAVTETFANSAMAIIKQKHEYFNDNQT